MTTWSRFCLAGSMLLAGCVPSGVARLPDLAPAPPQSRDPRVEPVMTGLLDDPPIWDAQPVSAAAVTVQPGVYVVKAGDGLYAIGDITGAGLDAIARANSLIAPYPLRPGQRLRIPAGRYHRVTSGQTGIAIARAYGLAWSDIVAANTLIEPFTLRAGQRLLLPGTAPPDAAARAAAFKIDIDDIVTGAAPAQIATRLVPPPSAPTRIARIERFAWPLVGTVAERFGNAGEGRVNRGIEIAGAPGTAIRAVADGTIAFVGNGGSAGYGGLILVRHADGWISVYGRAAQATVGRDQVVAAGQTIGTIGAESRLHFELRRNRVAVDPAKYLPPR